MRGAKGEGSTRGSGINIHHLLIKFIYKVLITVYQYDIVDGIIGLTGHESEQT